MDFLSLWCSSYSLVLLEGGNVKILGKARDRGAWPTSNPPPAHSSTAATSLLHVP